MSNQTVIALKSSGATGNTPSLGSLSSGELAINYADGIIYYKTATNSLGSIYTVQTPGVNKDVIFNDSGVLGAAANITFDKATSNLSVIGTTTTTTLNLSNIANKTSGTYTTVSTSPVAVNSFDYATYRTVKYSMQITSGSSYHSEEISIIHNGITPQIVEYGVVYTNGSLGSFDVIINGSNIDLAFTPVNASNTLKFIRTSISA